MLWYIFLRWWKWYLNFDFIFTYNFNFCFCNNWYLFNRIILWCQLYRWFLIFWVYFFQIRSNISRYSNNFLRLLQIFLIIILFYFHRFDINLLRPSNGARWTVLLVILFIRDDFFIILFLRNNFFNDIFLRTFFFNYTLF